MQLRDRLDILCHCRIVRCSEYIPFLPPRLNHLRPIDIFQWTCCNLGVTAWNIKRLPWAIVMAVASDLVLVAWRRIKSVVLAKTGFRRRKNRYSSHYWFSEISRGTRIALGSLWAAATSLAEKRGKSGLKNHQNLIKICFRSSLSACGWPLL